VLQHLDAVIDGLLGISHAGPSSLINSNIPIYIV
jgi:hypothetical protein